ncbi:short-chain dehydrogenase/reductase [Paenibacillus glycanilyticus]|uniref:Short-chain dehydrogenase/reductase n=1 Tax=Paenibacillus glycanilyticus TaxID=126569 RepID=A0ABQ6NQS5_9BACL|nr:oxidoreductase [Paenibacillus glycanilyticus]GMK47443.1 short-chain dehydrogenase/reductase [Paenibacillus glycanilyticus]
MSKVWLITGSSRGFGRELTKAVLDKGDKVVATARNKDQLDFFVKEYGDLVRTFSLDVTDQEAAHSAIQLAVKEFGSLDIVVNNAGYANSAPIEEMTDEDFRAQIETNLFGVVNVTKAALPVFHKQRSGYYIQFSSIGGRVGGTPGMGAYQTAKYAVEGFSEVLHNEVKPFGVKVTIIEPGAFRTDWQGSSMVRAKVGEDYEQTVGAINKMREETDGKQPGDPARAAQIIINLADLEAPPLRLILGAAALESALKSSKERYAEAEKWADLSKSADFPSE